MTIHVKYNLSQIPEIVVFNNLVIFFLKLTLSKIYVSRCMYTSSLLLLVNWLSAFFVEWNNACIQILNESAGIIALEPGRDFINILLACQAVFRTVSGTNLSQVTW